MHHRFVVVAVSLALVGTGCATLEGKRTDGGYEEAPKTELVYLVPLEEAMVVARQTLESKGFNVATPVPTELVTSPQEVGTHTYGARIFERYHVHAQALSPRHTVVRVFRVEWSDGDEMVETPMLKLGELDFRREQHENKAPLGQRKGGASKDASDPTGNVRSAGRAPRDGGQFQGEETLMPELRAWKLEPFRFRRGVRHAVLERELTARLESVPALELVGGALPMSMQSVVLSDSLAETLQTQTECTPLPGAAPLLVPGATVVLSDPLGTRELPGALAQLVCEAGAGGHAVLLGLSIPSMEQDLVDAYLASEGSSEDVATLMTKGTFWRRTLQDGRSSQAMLALMERARLLRREGKQVSVVAFDTADASGSAREAHMAEQLLAARARAPQAVMLVAAGDVHARPEEGTAWDGEFLPMGARLVRQVPGVRVLTASFQRGSQYGCRFNVHSKVECRIYMRSPTSVTAQPEGRERGVELFASPDGDGFAGRLHLGTLTASLPVVQRTGLASSGAPAEQQAPFPAREAP